MSLLEVENLRFKYTDQELYNDLSFRLLVNEHVCLLGKNGCGKSTFMNIIAKNILPDSGKIEWMPNIKYGYLDQNLKIDQDMSIKDYLTDVFKDLFNKEKIMQEYYEKLATCPESDYEKYLNRALSIQEELEEAKFYQIESTLGNIINGLGINAIGIERNIKTLSGGQKAKVILGKLLLKNPDVLLMDEPTNFLDVSHIEWLTKFLNEFKGSFIVISHDLDFVKNISNVIYELDNKKLEKYKGNYDFYLKEQAIRKDHNEKAYVNQQKFIKQTQEFIDKNIVRATTSKQAQSRRKVLEKLDIIEKPEKDRHLNIHFKFSKNLSNEVLKVENLVIGYDKPILNNLNFLITGNKKVAIVGHNGIGKSTLLKTILGFISPLSGTIKLASSADINYFEQEHLFSNTETAVEYIRSFYPLMTDKEIRTALGCLGITGSLATKKLQELSGGEQAKVRLTLMTLKKCNLLVLDEPTNHLDKLAKKALYKAIEEFPGAVLFVSHDADFYEQFIDLTIKL